MTSTHLELDQLANRLAWPVRALASSARLLDPVLGLLIGLRSLGVVHLSAATLLLAALLMLFLCVGARTLRRWSVAEAKQRERRSGATRPALRRVMIAGAGEHGLSIGHELAGGAAPGVALVGFLDDDSD